MSKIGMRNALVALVLLVFSSCAVIEPVKPPFVISKPVCKIGVLEANYECAGVEFDFYNTGNKTIKSMEVSCIVYDAETKLNPFIGSNIIRSSFTGLIPPGDSKKMILSLDSYMYVIPDEPYLIDFFYVAKITYTDNSSWADPNGTYFTRSY